MLILYDFLLLCKLDFFLTPLHPWSERTEQWHVKHLVKSSKFKTIRKVESIYKISIPTNLIDLR